VGCASVVLGSVGIVVVWVVVEVPNGLVVGGGGWLKGKEYGEG
jgi:hypothetical protein